MITKIEIEGFRSFKNTSFSISPFQIITGGSNTGKSNFCYALRFLSSLIDLDVRSAVVKLSNEIGELFSILPGNQTEKQIRISVELLVKKHIKDHWGEETEIKNTRLRYNLAIRKDSTGGIEKLHICEESLVAIKNDQPSKIDSRLEKYCHASDQRKQPFISTTNDEIILHADGDGKLKSWSIGKIGRSILSWVSNCDYPTVFAVREEIKGWSIFDFNPDMLKETNSFDDPQFMGATGKYLASMLAGMEDNDKHIMKNISHDLSVFCKGIAGIRVDRDIIQKQFSLVIETKDKKEFRSCNLSSGTLEMIALIAIKYDHSRKSVIVFDGCSKKYLSLFNCLFGDKINDLRQIILLDKSKSGKKYFKQGEKDVLFFVYL